MNECSVSANFVVSSAQCSKHIDRSALLLLRSNIRICNEQLDAVFDSMSPDIRRSAIPTPAPTAAQGQMRGGVEIRHISPTLQHLCLLFCMEQWLPRSAVSSSYSFISRINFYHENSHHPLREFIKTELASRQSSRWAHSGSVRPPEHSAKPAWGIVHLHQPGMRSTTSRCQHR